jgi:hypothetical protein
VQKLIYENNTGIHHVELLIVRSSVSIQFIAMKGGGYNKNNVKFRTVYQHFPAPHPFLTSLTQLLGYNLLYLGVTLMWMSLVWLSQDARMDWIIHLDTDELIHQAGAREYSLRRLLLDVPDNVDMVIFPNYVSHRSNMFVEYRNVFHVWLLCIYFFFSRKAALTVWH